MRRILRPNAREHANSSTSTLHSEAAPSVPITVPTPIMEPTALGDIGGTSNGSATAVVSGSYLVHASSTSSPSSVSWPSNLNHQHSHGHVTHCGTSDTESVYSGVSVTSTYRHHNTGPFMPPAATNAASTSSLSVSSSSPTTNARSSRIGNNISSNGGNQPLMALHASDSLLGAASLSVSSSLPLHHPHQPPRSPRPVLTADRQHEPRTRGSLGILIVGVGGANGATLLAGCIANQMELSWKGPVGEDRSPNYYGCITQIDSRGVHGGVGYRDRVKGLANVSMAAVGGWDIRPTRLGDALLQAQILDYDLVRQVQEPMNRIRLFRGLYDARFIGSSQHATATHVLTAAEAPFGSEALKCLRADIRYFKWRQGVVGHTTVIWSASVEPNCELLLNYRTADDLLDAIEMTEEQRGGPLPPSIFYATAAILEGCSFINGGSQNTLSCPGLHDLAQQQLGVYCLGTDFKAGQTKFKTAAVEYLRTIGMKPTVIASSNHLGNNDMRNLASSNTSANEAKLRVKHNIFAPWQEDQLDHKVSIMFTEFINDEKRDFVEYTSLGFLGQVHTMVTYTRASDSVLCVPLMIDGAVWCDYFSRRTWPYDKVSLALSYLFKIPEGDAQGVDPGFFRQMKELETQVFAAANPRDSVPMNDLGSNSARGGLRRENSNSKSTTKRVRIRPDEKTTEWAIPQDACIVCAGLACVDMQLNQATGGHSKESIETFEGEKSIAGGSVSMACKTLARFCHGEPLGEGHIEITPPVVNTVVPLCKVGKDSTGDKLIILLEQCGDACRNVDTKYIKSARERDQTARTALAVLPIYHDGRRGCFFDAASNTTFAAREMVEMMSQLTSVGSLKAPVLDTSQISADDLESYHADLEQMARSYGAFLFGYPHLLPRMQGEALAQILLEARSIMLEGGIVAVDLNGVSHSTFEFQGSLRSVLNLKTDPVIGAALEHIDILHMNEDELKLLTGCSLHSNGDADMEDELALVAATNLFLLCGVAVVAVTRGSNGAFVNCNDVDRFRRSRMLPASWAESSTKMPASTLAPDTVVNSNGAGDAFTAGFLLAAMLRHTGMTVPSNAGAEINARQLDSPSSATVPSPVKSPSKKKKKHLTPYTAYMREHYVSLRNQCNDDKKAIFSMCHDMWENETNEVKEFYERKAAEDNENDESAAVMSANVLDVMDALDASLPKASNLDATTVPRNLYMTNRSLNLESAVQFASLVASRHIDMKSRDSPHMDLRCLVDQALTESVPKGLEEI